MDLTGTYEATTTAGLVTITLRVTANGSLDGEAQAGPLMLRLAGTAHGLHGEGTATDEVGVANLVFQLERSGDQLGLQMLDLATGRADTVVLQRRDARVPDRARGSPATSPGAPAPRSGVAASLVGTWDGPRGRMRVDGDGTVVSDGQALSWAVDGGDVVLSGPGGSARVGFQLEGDRLRLTAGGQSESFTRIDLGDPMQAIAGVWVATESHIDPGIAMIITQYLTFYADGAASFEKSEGGASRTRISEHRVRFSSFHHAGPRSVNGRWRSDGATIEVQWSWRAGPVVGRVDPVAGKMVLAGVGILEEGATLTYERQ